MNHLTVHRFRRISPAHFRFLGAAMLALAPAVARGEPCDPCDANCDGANNLSDVAPFADTLLEVVAPCSECAGDANGDTLVDGLDIAAFIECQLAAPPSGACCLGADSCAETTETACAGLWMGGGTTCGAINCHFADLTAYRPQHEAGYFPFARTAVSDNDEMSLSTGPGIRINEPGDNDPSGEDDLIELVITTSRPELPLTLRRSDAALRVFSSRIGDAASEISFIGDRTAALPLTGATLTLWVEWSAASHGNALLTLEPLDAAFALDAVRFHTFDHVVMALGGEGQTPTVPVDANSGTFVVGTSLYQRGFDVFMYDEDNVGPDGSGAARNEAVTAVRDRLVRRIVIFGYSHGGGSTYDLADRLDADRAGIGMFEIVATSYADAVENDSDIDVSQELRRPPSTAWHGNHYQVGTLSDFFLDGGPVPNSEPAPTGLNVETTPWGAGSTHFTVDDYLQVRSFIETNVAARLAP